MARPKFSRVVATGQPWPGRPTTRSVLPTVAGGVLVSLRLDRPGVRRTDRDGLDVVEPVAAIELAGVEADALGPGRFGDRSLAAVRTLFAAELVGLAGQCVDAAVAYAKERHQFGRPIGSFQAVKHTLADRHAQVCAARLLLHWAAATGDPHTAGLAVQAAGDAADAASADNLQTHGGMGFTWEASAHVLLKRARARRALLGTSARQLDAVADRLLETRDRGQGPDRDRRPVRGQSAVGVGSSSLNRRRMSGRPSSFAG
ncbi:acyl-CoA dehydrogenase family protein [Streptomyces sp. NPDC002265]|uniref:acyl-CoA dehydrogenase family protein n=1 Tax=Streptomyces sp. NPDC002265 TaxID=3154415 RepID=UPI0033260F8D